MFVIGVDYQPASSFATWKARGINTVVRRQPNEDYPVFDSAAAAAGLKAIRDSQDPASLDSGSTILMAAASIDEPETKYCDYTTGRDAQFVRKNQASGAGVPFFTNYAGAWILNDTAGNCDDPPTPNSPPDDYCGIRNHSPNQWCYGEYMRATDWISFDLYPRNQGFDINSLSEVMTRIAAVYPAGNVPPRLVYIEASDYDCSGGYPNQWHVVYEAVQAVIAGARGIIYFPHGLAPGCTGADKTHDHTAVVVQQEMTRLNLALASVPAAAMQGTVNPTGVTFESGSTSGRIRWGTRSDGTNAYYFTENDSGTETYAHVVRFHGLSNCAGKTVTVLNDTITTTSPYAFADRTFQLDSSCQSTGIETWAPYRYHIYSVAID